MSEVCFRDHGALARNTRNAGGVDYGTILEPSLRPGLDDERIFLSDATHAVLHFSDEGEENEVAEWENDWRRLASPKTCLIMLMVSEGDRDHLTSAAHRKWENEEKAAVAYVLYARRQADALGGDVRQAIEVLQAFYDMKMEQAQAVFTEQSNDLPEPLQLLFARPVVAEILPALSILCQGYLAAHCGPDPASEHGFKVDVQSDSTEAIGRALRKMKWGDVLRSAQSLAAQLTSSDQLVRKPLRDHVSGASFWAVFAQTESTTLVQDAEREWKALRSACKFAESKTKRLIHSLPMKEGILADGDFGRQVAEAYLELAETLEKSQ